MLNIEETLQAYVECALWSSYNEEGIPLDAKPYELAPETVERMRTDVADFLEGCDIADVDLSDLDASQIGHDFWLTRNGHGAGFWDRGLGYLGDVLTAMAKGYGTFDLYVGDDEQVYAL